MPHTIRSTRACRRAQRGTSLLEAVLAFAVLAGGALSMSRLQHHLHVHADVARQRSEAVRIAQHDIESMRAYTTVHAAHEAASADTDYDRMTSAIRSIDQLDGAPLNAVYQLTRQLDTGADAGADAGADTGTDTSNPLRLKSTTSRVTWTARDGSAQRAVLHSAIAGTDPVMTGALNLAPGASSGTTDHARTRGLPPGAVDLGNGRSAFKPDARGTTALLFDHASGVVVASCEVPARVAANDLRPEHLSACREVSARLLSGVVRFSNARPPDAANANDAPLAVALSVALSDAPSVATSVALSVAPAEPATAASPWCHTEAQKTVQIRAVDGIQRMAVAIGAVPADVGAADWTDLGERFVAYHCLVPVTRAATHWSGASTLVPNGWTLGTAATDHRVCRYTAHPGGNAAADLNDAHPAVYHQVRHTLLQQNFLVIAGDQSCPDSAAARIGIGVLPAVNTAPHQP